MDGIKALSEQTFMDRQDFIDPAPDYLYEAMEISTPAKQVKGHGEIVGGGDVPRLQLNQDQLCAWLSSPPDHSLELPKATLRLARISRTIDVSLVISKSSFCQILDVMRADPSVKYMICQDYDGFHEYHSGGFLLTRFIGTPLHALVWTFDPSTASTTALYLDRRRELFLHFAGVLFEYRALVHTPSLLCFVSAYFLILAFDRESGGWEMGTIRYIESKTGFGPHPSGYRGLQNLAVVNKFNIDQLTGWLQAVSEIAGNASNRGRHQRISLELLDMIREEDKRKEKYGLAADHLQDRARLSLKALTKATTLVQRHISAYVEWSEYIKDRTERLSNVLFSLLTHSDADASIRLATASKRDSSSMKTIAVMTMAFLPATFFAALFAVPSLRWDQPKVVQDNFWIYLAFTIPSTVAIFLLWLLIYARHWIRRNILIYYSAAKTALA